MNELYIYDGNGNRLLASGEFGGGYYDIDPANQVRSDYENTYEYDNEGNRTVRFTDNGNGVLGAGDTNITEYDWDHRNRLTKVTKRASYDGAATHTIWYDYSASNELIRRISWDGVTYRQTVFAHEDGQVALQFDKTGFGNAAATNLSHRYLWGAAVDELLADEQVHDLFNAANNETLWALTDHLGSVRDVVDANGDLRIDTVPPIL